LSHRSAPVEKRGELPHSST